MKETNIPCSDCSTKLEKRTVHVRDLPISTDSQLTVDVAVCPNCEARYYPRETLNQIGDATVCLQLLGDT